MNSDEPAWYYVGDGRLRLWDGKQWTDRYRLANAPKPQPAKPQVPKAQAPKAQPGPRRATTSVGTDTFGEPGLEDDTKRGTRAVTWALVVAAAILAAVVGISLL
jgi:hypothetical protein